MTTSSVPAGLLRRAGLPAADAEDWAAAAPQQRGSLPAAAAATSLFLVRGQALGGRLPALAVGTAAERAAREVITGALNEARESFLRSHAAGLYDELTGCRTRPLRLDELSYQAAAQVPGLVPAAAELAAERAR